MNARDKLIEIYLDWYNNYATYARYAECNGLTLEQAVKLINLSREVANAEHPEGEQMIKFTHYAVTGLDARYSIAGTPSGASWAAYCEGKLISIHASKEAAKEAARGEYNNEGNS